jgi:hypothetical protein
VLLRKLMLKKGSPLHEAPALRGVRGRVRPTWDLYTQGCSVDFRYLRGTSKTWLKFGNTGKGLVGYVDSDFAADLDKRMSMCLLLVVVL